MIHPTYGPLRSHQAAAIALAQLILDGLKSGTVFADVTPGGGKTLMAVILASLLLDAGFFHVVVWMAPSLALLKQVRDGFHQPGRNLLRHLAVWGEKKRISVGQRSTKGHECVGYVLTYATTLGSIKALLRSLRGKRILLILDECHRLSVDPTGRANDGAEEAPGLAKTGKPRSRTEEAKQWQPKVDLLRSQAAMTLMMSGTSWRHDGRKMPYLEGHYDASGDLTPDISYSRREALDDKATLPMVFDLADAEVEFESAGRTYKMLLSAAPVDLRPKALRTFLASMTTRNELIENAVAHWRQYRADRYRSRMLVLCSTQQDARDVADYLTHVVRAGEVVTALGDEPDAAKKLNRFRSMNEGDILVTVKMAFEGFDVPNLSHVVVLSVERSVTYLDQCLNRATRVNYECGLPWEKQAAYIFMPKDGAGCQYVESIHNSQRHLDSGVHEERERAIAATTRTSTRKSTFQAKGATPVAHGFGDDDGLLTPEQNDLVARARAEIPEVFDWRPRAILAMLDRVKSLGVA